jgi:hypothetical protein
LYDLNRYYGVYHPASTMAETSKVRAEEKLAEILGQFQTFLDKQYHPFIKGNSEYPYLKEYTLNK